MGSRPYLQFLCCFLSRSFTLMVFMDNRQRTAQFAFWRRTILGLSLFSILYMGVIRPTQVDLVQNVLAPAVVKYSLKYNNINVSVAQDELFLVPLDFPKIRFDLPFGGFFLLPLTLFIISRKHQFILTMCVYHGILLILFPIVGVLIFKGSYVLATLTIVHEKFYKAIFIIIGLLALREYSNSILDRHK
jgi:hypothetical protein